MERLFRCGDRENLTIENVLEEMVDYIESYQENEFKIYIGSDSLWREKMTCFATCIVLHRVGKNAKLWYTKNKLKFPRSIPARIMKEASDSVEIIQSILDSAVSLYVPEENFEVHIDCGAKGESKSVIKEVLGYVRGMGLNCEIKPNAAIAANVADRFTHG